jgi:hypothetical protein
VRGIIITDWEHNALTPFTLFDCEIPLTIAAVFLGKVAHIFAALAGGCLNTKQGPRVNSKQLAPEMLLFSAILTSIVVFGGGSNSGS